MSNPLALLETIEAVISEYGTPIVWGILALPFLIVFLVLAIPFIVRGCKQGLYKAIVSLASSVIAVIGSVFLSQLFAMLISNFLFGTLLGVLGEKLSSISETLSQILVDGTYLGSLVQWIVSTILAFIFFIILFIILLIVCKIVIGKMLSPFINKLDKPTLSGFGGFAVRVLDAALIAFLFFAPFYSVLGCGMNILEDTALGIVATQQEELAAPENSADADVLSEEILAITSPFTKCPMVKIAGIPGLNFGERVFGSFMCDGKLYNAYDILDQGTDVLVLSMNLTSKKMSEYGPNELEILKSVVDVANENDFYYGVFSDVLRLAPKLLSEQIELDQAFGKSTATQEIILAFLAPFENCTASDVKDCANAIVGIFDSAVKNNVFNNADRPAMLFNSMANGSFIDEAVPALRSSKLLSKTADNILLYSLNYINFSSENKDNAQIEQTIEQLKNRVEASISEGTVDTEKEIYAFKTMFGGFAALYDSTDGFKNLSFESISSKGIADLLTGLGSHPHIGSQGAEDLINTALPSFGAAASILTDDFIKAATNALVSDIDTPPANGAQGKFENLLATAQNLTNAITNGFGDGKDKEKLNSTIDMLLSDMTPESAEAVTTVLTKDVMDSINKNGANTGSTEGFVKDLITNMANYDAPDKAALEKEREAIIKMNDLVLDADNKLNNKTEEQTSIEAAVGGDLKGFVNDVSSSVVLMGTINNSFESNPEKETDPTGMFSSMGQQDKEKLNSVCEELLQDDSVSAEQKENIKNLCLFMGGSVA